jgi:hypothetical protein
MTYLSDEAEKILDEIGDANDDVRREAARRVRAGGDRLRETLIEMAAAEEGRMRKRWTALARRLLAGVLTLYFMPMFVLAKCLLMVPFGRNRVSCQLMLSALACSWIIRRLRHVESDRYNSILLALCARPGGSAALYVIDGLLSGDQTVRAAAGAALAGLVRSRLRGKDGLRAEDVNMLSRSIPMLNIEEQHDLISALLERAMERHNRSAFAGAAFLSTIRAASPQTSRIVNLADQLLTELKRPREEGDEV